MYLYLILGFVGGVLFTTVLAITGRNGYLRIDTTDKEKDYYLLEFRNDLSKVHKKKYVIFKVDNKYKRSL